MTKSKELFIITEPISKLYTDDMGRFPIRSCCGNNFIMLAYHFDTNVILVEPFASCHDRHRLAAADCIMANLAKRGHGVNLQILDNECSAAYKLQIKENEEPSSKLSHQMSTAAKLPNGPSARSKHISSSFWRESLMPFPTSCGTACYLKQKSP